MDSSRHIWIFAVVSVLFFVLYFGLRSQHYLEDGLRHLKAITESQAPRYDGYNHLLYPTIGWYYYRAVGAFYTPQDKIGRMEVMQSMNALLGALGLFLFALILFKATGHLGISLAGTTLLGFSYAYMFHSIDASEPMLSFVLACLAILAAQSRRPLTAGIMLALSLSCYLPAIFLIPPLLYLLCKDAPKRKGVTFLLVTLTVSFLIYRDYIPETRENIEFVVPKWFEFTPFKLFRDYFGLTNAIVYLPHTISRFFDHTIYIQAIAFASIILVLAGQIWFVCIFIKQRKGFSDDERKWIRFSLIWILCTLILPLGHKIAWYEKLWILPLAGIVMLCCIIFKSVVTKKRALFATAAFAFIVCVNLSFGAAYRHFTPSVYLEVAKEVQNRADSRDLVVVWGVDSVSSYLYYLSDNIPFSSFDNAYSLEFDIEGFKSDFASRLSETYKCGGKVLFANLLDIPLERWQKAWGFYTTPENVEKFYHVFDYYRTKSKRVKSWWQGYGVEDVSIWEYSPK